MSFRNKSTNSWLVLLGETKVASVEIWYSINTLRFSPSPGESVFTLVKAHSPQTKCTASGPRENCLTPLTGQLLFKQYHPQIQVAEKQKTSLRLQCESEEPLDQNLTDKQWHLLQRHLETKKRMFITCSSYLVTILSYFSMIPFSPFVHGILQARILEWVASPFSMGSSQPRDRIRVSGIADRFFTVWATREAPLDP